MPEIELALKSALRQGMIREEDSAVMFYDLAFFTERLNYLIACFPATTLHGLAVKANPLRGVMELASETGRNQACNIGVEAASIGEVDMALNAGYDPSRIVYDSPVKTLKELEFALASGVHINIDNLDELERVNLLLKTTPSTSTFGIRINPQVGVGTILESSVAGEYSKFGVPIGSRKEELTKAFLTFPWLQGMHLHVGSQGCSTEMLVRGIGVLYDFALTLNQLRTSINFPPINIFDIGGGLPVSYNGMVPASSMGDYAAAIKQRAPMLSAFKIITEFGRWIYTNAGWTVSKVEYVKHDPGVNTAMLHVGADLFIRECLNPKDWQHEYSVYDKTGNLKMGNDTVPYTLAGPLCFAGDILARGVILPVVEAGDYLVIHDTGSYTFSMWSHYNSRQTPRILGYSREKFEILKERQGLGEVRDFWK